MNRVLERLASSHATGLIVVLLLHGAVLYGLWNMRMIPDVDEAVNVFVTLISPSSPPSAQSGQAARPAPEPPKPVKPTKPVKPAGMARMSLMPADSRASSSSSRARTFMGMSKSSTSALQRYRAPAVSPLFHEELPRFLPSAFIARGSTQQTDQLLPNGQVSISSLQ